MNLFQVMSALLDGGLKKLPVIEVRVYDSSNVHHVYTLLFNKRVLQSNEIRFTRYEADGSDDTRSSRLYYWNNTDRDYMKKTKALDISVTNNFFKQKVKIRAMDSSH